MKSFIDRFVSAPNKIDFYYYAPGAGGSFFGTLCSLAHYKTRDILSRQSLNITTRSGPDDIIYSAFQGMDMCSTDGHSGLRAIAKNINIIGEYLSADERIDYIKMALFHGLLSYCPKEDIITANYYNDKNIIITLHWMLGVTPPPQNSSQKMKDAFQNRKFGIPEIEKQSFLSIINLNPQTERAKDMVKRFNRLYFYRPNKSILEESKETIPPIDELTDVAIDHPTFQNMKLKFPFMDYMVDNDFKSIIYYIEDRYGPDIDYDFIDQALIDYKKIRVDPYL